MSDSEFSLPRQWLSREDESEDALFYATPRLVTHIDDETIEALSGFYVERLEAGGGVLDLMSSWVSHLPAERAFSRVAGLGMNEEELMANSRLDDHVVHDLNEMPELPYGDAEFDAVLIAVSVQYLIHPVEVFRGIGRVLRPGGQVIVAMSHRLFPTKAVRAFRSLEPTERIRLVAAYCTLAGSFDPAEFFDRSPKGADPLWIVTARRSTS
ncbi:MAG: methyltransferase domain-containing protein [Gammaproteobacteria bacterium]|nr:methyltransferase domain-containing protein [Gammaproteobacteria bacterium]